MRINQEGQFYARLLSRESSSESRLVCYEVVGVPGSVPFGWESRPGTPIACGGRALAGTGAFIPSLRPPPSSFRQLEERGDNVADGKKKGKNKPSGLRAVTARVLGLRLDCESSQFSCPAGWTSWSDRSSFPSSCGASSLFCLGVRRHPRCGLLDEEKSTQSGSR